MTHFNSSCKCIENSCNQELHLDWWRLGGIKKKPIVGNATKNGGVHMGKGKLLP
jgi:hypothetical protein